MKKHSSPLLRGQIGQKFITIGEIMLRPSKITYDRRHSTITEYDFSKTDLDALLDGFDWLHLSGITPAQSANCAQFVLGCLKKAKEMGLTVSICPM